MERASIRRVLSPVLERCAKPLSSFLVREGHRTAYARRQAAVEEGLLGSGGHSAILPTFGGVVPRRNTCAHESPSTICRVLTSASCVRVVALCAAVKTVSASTKAFLMATLMAIFPLGTPIAPTSAAHNRKKHGAPSTSSQRVAAERGSTL